MRYSLLLPLALLGLAGCVVQAPPGPATTTYVTPVPTATIVTPPTTTYVTPAYSAPSTTTTVIRTP
jgi:hypothetical protein